METTLFFHLLFQTCHSHQIIWKTMKVAVKRRMTVDGWMVYEEISNAQLSCFIYILFA